MEKGTATRARRWGALYVALGAGLIVAAFMLRGSTFAGNPARHTLLESIAALLALFVGLLALVHYYTGHSSRFLFIGSGFIAAAVLDGYHTVATGGWLPLEWPSAAASLTSWSWYPSRLLLAVLLLVSWRSWERDESQGGLSGAREWLLHAVMALMTVSSFALFVFVDLPPAYRAGGLLGRPHELLVGAIFLLALAGYLQNGRWRHAVFERWVVVFLILSAAVQLLFMPFSRTLFDARFDAAHFLKIASYGTVLVGLLLNMRHVYDRARESARALEVLNRELEQRVLQRTEDLEASELRFRRLFAAHPHPMWVFDTETLAFLEVNNAAEAQYGYSREEFLQMGIMDIRPQEDVPRLMDEVQRERPALNAAREWRHRLKDGTVIDVEISSHELLYEERPARLVVARDITEREAARRALAARARQFNVLAELGLRALSDEPLQGLLDEAVITVASVLDAEFCKMLQLLPEGDAFLLRAGVGWKAEFAVGEAIVSGGRHSQAGYTLTVDEPVVVADLAAEERFHGSRLLYEHDVVSGLSVIIHGRERPYGVLGVHTSERRDFDADQINFVQAVANVLAAAIERRQTERLLTEREERFRALVQRAMDMVTILGADGEIIYDSPAVERVLGYEPQERFGQNALAYVHPEDVVRVQQRIAEVVQAPGDAVRTEVRVRHKDGSWRVVEATGSNMIQQRGVEGIVVNWHDITELREAAQALEERKRILRSILDSMAEGVIVADEAGNFILFNRAAKQLLGVDAKQTGPEGWATTYNLHYPGETALVPAEELPLVRALQGEAVDDVDLFVHNPQQPEGLFIRNSARPLVDQDGQQQGGLAVFTDITAQRRAEQEIRQLNAELEKRVRERTAQLQQSTAQLQAANKELEAFAYSVSHDLRAPLRAMDGFSRILMEEFDERLPAPAHRYLRRIRHNAQQMGHLIDDLLAFSRLSRQELATRPVQPEQLVREALQQLAEEQEGRQVQTSVEALPQVHADPRLLKVVFVNLLGNALKYTRAREVARIEVGAKRANGASPVFYVRDNGVGFDMKYADKLFGVFQRLHKAEEYEGTGVGLATVQRIVQRHGGQVWAEAQVDGGATFYFTIGDPVERE